MSEVALDENREIRCVVLNLDQVNILIPTSTVLEVVAYQAPHELEDSPEWLLGTIRWRMQSIPLLSMQATLGMPSEEIRPGARIIICNTLGENKAVPFIGIQTTQIPHLARLTQENFQASDYNDPLGMMHCEIETNNERSLLPDLEAIETRLANLFAEQ